MRDGRLVIVHVVQDEKFIDSVIAVHDSVSCGVVNRYVILGSRAPLRYVAQASRIEFVPPSGFLAYLRAVGADSVLLHSLSLPLALLRRIDSGISVVWFSWGYDIYNPLRYDFFPDCRGSVCGQLNYWLSYTARPLVDIECYGPLTKAACPGLVPCVPSRAVRLRQSVRRMLVWPFTVCAKRRYRQAIARVDYVSTVLDIEFPLLRRCHWLRAEQVHYAYLNVSSPVVCGVIDDIAPLGGDIVVAHSASPQQNHLDVLQYLRRCDIGRRKVFLPLSYGETGRYADVVVAEYAQAFGDAVHAVRQFVPYAEFSAFMQGCGIAIYGCERQQAIGNIRLALWLGQKVFLSATSITYRHFRQCGMVVFTIQHDLCTAALHEPLTREQILHNRRALRQAGDIDMLRRDIQTIYDKCLTRRS